MRCPRGDPSDRSFQIFIQHHSSCEAVPAADSIPGVLQFLGERFLLGKLHWLPCGMHVDTDVRNEMRNNVQVYSKRLFLGTLYSPPCYQMNEQDVCDMVSAMSKTSCPCGASHAAATETRQESKVASNAANVDNCPKHCKATVVCGSD